MMHETMNIKSVGVYDMKYMEIKWNLKLALDEDIFKFKHPNVKSFQCNNSEFLVNVFYLLRWMGV
jgi:hypothetical protein